MFSANTAAELFDEQNPDVLVEDVDERLTELVLAVGQRTDAPLVAIRTGWGGREVGAADGRDLLHQRDGLRLRRTRGSGLEDRAEDDAMDLARITDGRKPRNRA